MNTGDRVILQYSGSDWNGRKATIIDTSDESGFEVEIDGVQFTYWFTEEFLSPMELDLSKLTMSTGYIGSLGESWKTPTAETIEQAIAGAMELNNLTREQVIEKLFDGETLNWCKSPNYYYDHNMGRIGTKRKPRDVKMVKCDCGCTVPASAVMSASLGTSCPDCYDRMSN